MKRLARRNHHFDDCLLGNNGVNLFSDGTMELELTIPKLNDPRPNPHVFLRMSDSQAANLARYIRRALAQRLKNTQADINLAAEVIS